MSEYVPCRAGNEWPMTTLADAGLCQGCGQRPQCPARQPPKAAKNAQGAPAPRAR